MSPTEIDPFQIPTYRDWDFPPEVISPRLMEFALECTTARAVDVINLPETMTMVQIKQWLATLGKSPANAAELIAFALRVASVRRSPLPIIAPGSSAQKKEQGDYFELYPTMITMLGQVDWVVGAVTRPVYFDKKLQKNVAPATSYRSFSTNYHVLVRA